MAPEVFEFRRYSQKSDVYSLGILLWELWSNCRVPFALVTQNEEVARRVLAGERPPIPQGCPAGVQRLMHACWKQKPDERPGFLQLKMRIQSEEPVKI